MDQEFEDKIKRLEKKLCCKVQQYESLVDFPDSGKTGTLYIDSTNEQIYFWNGTEYIALGGSSEEITALLVTVDDSSFTEISGTNVQDVLSDIDTVIGGLGTPTGLEAINEGNGIGWRLIGRNPANYGNIGNGAIDLSYSVGASATRGATGQNSFASGQNTTASGSHSTSFGYQNTASGPYSTSWGHSNNTSGYYATTWGMSSVNSGTSSTVWGRDNTVTSSFSTAWGVDNNLSGDYTTVFGTSNDVSGEKATAWGSDNFALGNVSTVWGTGNTVNSSNATVLGSFATIATGQSTSSLVGTDELFKIGNGTSSGARSNALKIYKNAVQVQGGITAIAATALTPEPGMIAYVTSTDATFVTTGFWVYQAGAWKAV